MWRVCVLAAVLVVSNAGCDVNGKVQRMIRPVPVVMDWDPVYRPFSDNEAQVTIRNTGDEGYVKITCTNAGRTWTTREYFNRGEERKVIMVLTNCNNFRGLVHIKVDAATD